MSTWIVASSHTVLLSTNSRRPVYIQNNNNNNARPKQLYSASLLRRTASKDFTFQPVCLYLSVRPSARPSIYLTSASVDSHQQHQFAKATLRELINPTTSRRGST